jgi:CubicO group peptidase (beta-lactamase class C family)
MLAQHEAPASSWRMLGPRVDSLFLDVDSSSTPGCVAGVSREGSGTLYRSYGSANLESATRNDTATIFEAGSVSKQFTAAAIVLLAQTGRLSLDDTVRRWIPELSKATPSFTIRQMLHHESGLRDYGSVVELTGWPRGSRAYTIDDILPVLARQHALNFQPGAEYSYSNSNYVLAAVIVARASGESFESFTHRAIFAPLGMTHTSWRGDYTRVVPHRAAAWSPDDSAHWHLDMPFENVIGHAGLLTTVPDLLRWQENFRHPTVGGTAFVREMQTDGVLNDGSAAHYALGLALETIGGAAAITHSGATAGYRAYVGRIPDAGIAVALLCNNGALNTQKLGPAMLALASEPHEPDSSASMVLGGEATVKNLAVLSGIYRSRRTRQPTRIRMYDKGLTVNGNTEYETRDGATYVSADGMRTLTFELDRAGSPVRYRAQIEKSQPVVFDRVAEWQPATRALQEFAGSYVSEEASASWLFRVKSDTLGVVVRPGVFEAMRPLYRDAFDVPSEGWLLTFRRNRAGTITGFDVGTTRMRTMPFTKRSPAKTR